MKKILFLLLCTVSIYGQTYPTNPTKFGKISLNTNGISTSTNKINTQEADGQINYINAVDLPVPTSVTDALNGKQATLVNQVNIKSVNQLSLLGSGDINPATSTAVISGCTIENNGTTFNVTPGTFEIVTNTYPLTRNTVMFAGVTNVTPLYTRTILYINPSGTLVQFNGASGDLTPIQLRQNAFLGGFAYSGGVILAPQNTPNLNYDIDGRFADLSHAIGVINQEGNVIGANGANLQINKGAGLTFRLGSNFQTDRKVPDITTDIAIIPIPAGINAVGYRNGSGGWTYEAYTGSITPTFYDNGTGTKAVLGGGKFTNQRVYFFNGTNTFIVYLGQTIYNSIDEAVAGVNNPTRDIDPATSLASLRSTISLRKETVALNNTAFAIFTDGPRLNGGASGSAVSGTTNLQGVYNNSVTPQITTSTALGSLDVRNGGASDAVSTLRVQNLAGASTFSVSGAGGVVGNTWNGYTPENVANKSTDFSVVDNVKYPSVQAVKTYADNLVVGLLDDRGTYNASSNVFPSIGGSGTAGAILKGDIWYVGTAGTLGGQSVSIGDSFRALIDTPAQTLANWSIMDGNINYVPANDANVVHLTGNETIAGTKIFTNDINTNSRVNLLTSTSPTTGVPSIGNVSGKFYIANSANSSGYFTLSNSWSDGTTKDFAFPAQSGTVALTSNPTSITATSFIKSGATTGNILLAGGADIAQSTFQTSLTNPVTGTGTTNFLPKFTGSSTVGNSGLFDDGTNLGIGTASPLSIGSGFRSIDLRGSVGAGISFGNATKNYYVYGDSSLNIETVSDPIRFNIGGTKAMLYPSGNLLIATSTDDGVNKLQVNGGGKFTGTTTVAGTFVVGNGTGNFDIATGGAFVLSETGVSNRFSITNTTGVVKINNLSGTGTRTVVADASGNLSATDAAPTSGIYTPTYTTGTNVTGVTNVTASYVQIGNIVTAYFRCSVTVTTPNTNSDFRVSLPVSTSNATSIGLLANLSSNTGPTMTTGYRNATNTTYVSVGFKHPNDTIVTVDGSIRYSVN